MYGGQTTLSTKLFKGVFTTTVTLVPQSPMPTDSNGEIAIPGLIHQQGNPADYYLQFAVLDPSTNTWSISNGVKVNQTINIKAVVNNAGYKLISNVSAGLTELYYLPTDPRETIDLLSLGIFALTPE